MLLPSPPPPLRALLTQLELNEPVINLRYDLCDLYNALRDLFPIYCPDLTSLQSSLRAVVVVVTTAADTASGLIYIFPHWKSRESTKRGGGGIGSGAEAISGSVDGSTFCEFARWPFRRNFRCCFFRLLLPSLVASRCCPCPVPTPRVEWQSARTQRERGRERERQRRNNWAYTQRCPSITRAHSQLLPSSTTYAGIIRSFHRFMASPLHTRRIICENMLISSVCF